MVTGSGLPIGLPILGKIALDTGLFSRRAEGSLGPDPWHRSRRRTLALGLLFLDTKKLANYGVEISILVFSLEEIANVKGSQLLLGVKFNSWLVSMHHLLGLLKAVQLEEACSETFLAGRLVEVATLQESEEVHNRITTGWIAGIHGWRWLLAPLDDLIWNRDQVLFRVQVE